MSRHTASETRIRGVMPKTTDGGNKYVRALQFEECEYSPQVCLKMPEWEQERIKE